ncbi:MAG: protein kinase domain-containing protein [Planctomycetota bacterium]|jgi:serine/threonine protein kinase
MTDCLSPSQLRQYLADELSPEDELVLSAHLAQCPACRERAEAFVKPGSTDELQAALDQLRSSARDEAVPDGTLESLRRLPTSVSRSQSSSPATTELPETIGRYRIIRLLGQGATGSVFLASATSEETHPHCEQPISDSGPESDSQPLAAIKLLDADCVSNPLHRRRFERERDALERLPAHRNIVRVLDSCLSNELCYLVMQYAGGRSLHEVVLNSGPLRVEEACRLTLQAATGLEHLHSHRLIHRDIKPSNLIVDDNNFLRIVDFGIVHLAEVEAFGSRLTATNALIGTVDFMAPEQAMAVQDVDERSDIYSLGCTLAWLLTGRRVYEFSRPADVLSAHNSAPVPSLRDRRAEIPRALDELFQRMLAKSLDDRPDSMSEVIAGIEHILKSDQPVAIQREGHAATTSLARLAVITVCCLAAAAAIASFVW